MELDCETLSEMDWEGSSVGDRFDCVSESLRERLLEKDSVALAEVDRLLRVARRLTVSEVESVRDGCMDSEPLV